MDVFRTDIKHQSNQKGFPLAGTLVNEKIQGGKVRWERENKKYSILGGG